MPAADDPGAYSKPVTPLQLFEGRRSRRRREAPKVETEDPESKVQYTVCIWWVLGLSGEGVVGRGRAGGRAGPQPGPQAVQLAPPPCRRKGKVGLSGMAIADITLLSGFHALRADLEKVPSATHSRPPSLGALLHLGSTPGTRSDLWPSPLPCS